MCVLGNGARGRRPRWPGRCRDRREPWPRRRDVGAFLRARPAGRDVRTETARAAARCRPAARSRSSADVRDSSGIEGFGAAAIERFGRIDLWVNNAGVIEPIGKLADVDPGMLAHHISVNVIGVVNGIRTFARHVRRRPGVACSSTSAPELPPPFIRVGRSTALPSRRSTG